MTSFPAWVRAAACRVSRGRPAGLAWAVTAILRQHGISVDLVTTTSPGFITHEDEHQVAAIQFADR